MENHVYYNGKPDRKACGFYCFTINNNNYNRYEHYFRVEYTTTDRVE